MNLFVRATAFSLALAAPLAAQAPRTRTASFDVGALTNKELRLNVEPLRFGPLAIDISLAARDNAPPASSGIVPVAMPQLPHGAQILTGREYDLDVGGRLYSSALHLASGPGISLYVGALAGFHRRDSQEPPCQGACPAVLYITPINQGVEPTGEIGARFLPNSAVLLDVGMRTRFITFPDPIGNYSVGQVVPRLSLSLGVNW